MAALALSLLLAALLLVARTPDTRAIFPGQTAVRQQAPSICAGPCRCGVLNNAQLRTADTGAGARARQKRFVGGEQVRANLYPWLVAITRMSPYQGFSTGALISDRHVLTSASAVLGVPAAALRVSLSVGAMCGQPDTRAVNVSVLSVSLRSGDASAVGGDDLAVLRLASPVRFNPSLRPVCLPSTTSASYIGVMSTVLGFGGNATEPLDASSTAAPTSTTGFLQRCRARTLLLPVVSPNQCASSGASTGAAPVVTAITTSTGCVGSPGAPQIVCPSDAGSLIQVPGARREIQLIGVMTNTNNCTDPETEPAQFTRTAPNLRWLLDQTADGCFCAAP